MKKIILLFFAALLCFSMYAQTHYSCDFEESAECSNWHLNSLKSSISMSDLDQWWFIGQAGNCGAQGQNGLFISSDGTQAIYDGTNSEFITAYRDISFSPGQYTLRFDWRLAGKSNDKLVVALVPTSNNCLSGKADVIPNEISQKQIVALRGSSPWSSFTCTFQISKDTTMRLAFYFFCKNGGAKNSSACVDNIEIVPSDCPAPTSVNFDTKTDLLTWTGDGTTYDVRYYNMRTNIWHEQQNVVGHSCKVDSLSTGYNYLYVRQVCDSVNHSAWVKTFRYLVTPGCVDYMNIGENVRENDGICYAGNRPSTYSEPDFGEYPKFVDYGCQVDSSLHTVCYDPDLTDPNSGVSMTPDDETPSVRIGAYSSSGLDARIEYKYTVEAGVNDTLVLNYACVLQSGGHGGDESFFRFDILDEQGQAIADFTPLVYHANETGDKWNATNWGVWSDWDQELIPLRSHKGQTLTLQVTASRCAFDTHWGYAYYTLDCRAGEPDTDALSEQKVDSPAVKFLRDGCLYILRNGQTYDASGREVKK